jgi:hypothetical protein
MSAKLTVLAYSNFHVLAFKFNHFKRTDTKIALAFFGP